MITILLFAFFANAHVVTKTERGENVHWESNLLSIKISTKNYGNSSFNLTTQDLENIIKDSVGEWNSLSNIKIVTSVTDEKVSIGRKNTISFSEKENYFG